MMKPTFLTYEKPLLTVMVQASCPERVKELMDKARPEGAEAFGMQFCRMKEEYRREDIYRELDCRGFARVDFFLDHSGELYFNEINTVSRRFVLDTAGLNCDPIADEPITEKCRNEWRNLWAQLSVENGPWYPKQSGGTVVTFKRDRSVCTRSLCPFKMLIIMSLNGSVKWLDTSRAKLVFSV